METWPYLFPVLIVAPFAKNKVLTLIFIMTFNYFLPDKWQLWITLYFVGIITGEVLS